jgi:ATP-dependent protease HslVU (ClpYQ) peptidase subunit
MTIALGFTSGPLSVIASESEITVGGEAVQSGKISSMWRAEPSGAIAVTGAGSNAYVQTLSSEVQEKFGDWKGSIDEFGVWLKEHVREFYKKHISELSHRLNPPPLYRVLVMAHHDHARRFWSTERTLLVPENTFKAIGSGGPMATGLLSGLYRPYLKLNDAAILTTYVIYRVKRSVQGCGFDTEIRFLLGDRFGIVPKTFVDRCEKLLEKYEALNKDFFYLTTALPMSEPKLKLPPRLADQIKPIPERTMKDVLNDVEELRADFAKLEVIAGNKTI